MKSSIKVLIVDDDRSSATLISEVVKRMGFKPVVTTKPTDALNVAKLQTVDAAIVDVMLPKMSGVDLAGEFRATKFADNPIILVSGVFKDKSFATDAMKKSGAKEFLFKPYAAEDLQNVLKKILADQLTTEKLNLESLLMRQLNSVRERSKAIEHLEPIQGRDFPFVLSLLTEDAISGQLNLVSDSGEIYGVTISRGTISDVDSADSQSVGILSLIAKGFLAQEDWENFQTKSKKKPTLERLVAEGLISPHAVSVAKHEQILADFKTICGATDMQLNFSLQDDADEPPKHAVAMSEVLEILSVAMDEFFPVEHLEKFYAGVLSAPIKLHRSAADLAALWQSKKFVSLPWFRELLDSNGTVESLLHKHPEKRADIFACLHHLVLSRSVRFDDLQRISSQNKTLERYKGLYEQLKNAKPDQVFKYFGAGDRPQPALVEKIYAEYVRNNSPEQLARQGLPELTDLAKKCFEIVTMAKEVMLDENKRQAVFDTQKAEDAQRLKKSNELVAKGLESLRKGQFAPAITMLKEAEKNQSTTLQFLILTWAEVKAAAITTKPALLERQKQLEALTAEEKHSAYFHMAYGLVKKALGDQSAQASFEKVLELDPSFAEARREVNALQSKAPKKFDLLNGDITDVVSQLFRRKAE